MTKVSFVYRLLDYNSLHCGVCMISDSLSHCGSFSKHISGSQLWCHSSLHSIMCGSERFKCRNVMSSFVSEPPHLYASQLHWPYPPKKPPPPPIIPTLLQKPDFEAADSIECINVRSQMHQQLGPGSVCHLEPEYHECMSSLYRDTNHLAPSVNLFHGEKWKKTEQEFNFIWNVFQMWTAGFPFPLQMTWSCRIITSACMLTCIGTCTHILIHWGNSFKAIEYLTPHFLGNASLCQVL